MKPQEIRRLLKIKNWSQNELARQLDMDPATVSRWVQGKVEPPGAVSVLLHLWLEGKAPTRPELQRMPRPKVKRRPPPERRISLREVRELMRLKGWSQVALSRALDRDRSTVSVWLTRERDIQGPAAILMRQWLAEAREAAKLQPA